jgi:hypothetical protein
MDEPKYGGVAASDSCLKADVHELRCNATYVFAPFSQSVSNSISKQVKEKVLSSTTIVNNFIPL